MLDGTKNAILFPKRQVAKTVIADDSQVSFVVCYIGSEASATITVASSDITFKHGDLGAEAVDPTIDSGGDDDGVIDVSDANANTMGEVVDLINASPNWRAYLVTALRADASAGTYVDFTERTLVPFVDSNLLSDSSGALDYSIRIGSRENTVGNEDLSAAEVYSITSKNTYSSGTNFIYVYEIDEVKKTETLIFARTGGATTVEQTLDLVTSGRGGLASSKVGTHLLVRMKGSAACTGYLQVTGAVAKGV